MFAPLLLAAALAAPPAPPADAPAEEVAAFYLADREPLVPAWDAAMKGDDAAAQIAAIEAVKTAEAAALTAANAGLADDDPRRGDVLNALRAELLGSHKTLADLHEATGKWDAAETELAAALTLTEATHGPDDWRTGDARRAIEYLQQRRDLTDEQRARLAEAAIEDEAMMADYGAGRYDAAAVHARTYLEARREVLGPRHLDTAAGLNNLAIMLQMSGDLAAARPLYERASEIQREVLGPRHPDTAPA